MSNMAASSVSSLSTQYIIVFFLLFRTLEATESCNKDGSDNKDKSCGCSTNRQHSEHDVASENHEQLKYSVPENQATLDSPYKRTNQMVLIPEGSFLMGTDKPIFIADGEGPTRKAKISQFYLDKYEVSNAEFELFVNATGYKTEVSCFFFQGFTQNGNMLIIFNQQITL